MHSTHESRTVVGSAMRKNPRERGVAMVFVVVMGMLLLMLTVVSLQTTLSRGVATTGEWQTFQATQIRDSGAAAAIAAVKEAGIVAPMSGGGAAAQWVRSGDGAYYYYTTYDAATGVSIIRAWGRIAATTSPSTSTAAPDSVLWD